MLRHYLATFIFPFFAVLLLAACTTPTPTSPPTPLLAGEERRGEVTLTATLLPSASPTLTPPPTATATRTVTATPTRTAAEARAAALRALPGYAWQAKGDAITLTDAKGTVVAILDTAASGVKWTGDFAPTLNPLLTTDAGRQTLATFLKTNPDIHFLSYPDERGGNYAPYAVVLDTNGNPKIIQGLKAVADFTYDTQAGKIVAQFADNSGYYTPHGLNLDF